MSQPVPPSPPPIQTTPSDIERLKITVDVWKYIVSVQMHFNDIEMKVRNLYFTILAASLGLVGVVQGRRIDFVFLQMQVSLSLLVIFAIIPVSMLFYFMDRHWYHRLLQGAVNQAIEIEAKYAAELPEIQLGSKIRDASPVAFPKKYWKWLFFFIRDSRFREKSNLHSDQKIEVLYKSVIWAATIIIIGYGILGGVQFRQCALLPWVFGWPCGGGPSNIFTGAS